jgi:hypothetical protein
MVGLSPLLIDQRGIRGPRSSVIMTGYKINSHATRKERIFTPIQYFSCAVCDEKNYYHHKAVALPMCNAAIS